LSFLELSIKLKEVVIQDLTIQIKMINITEITHPPTHIYTHTNP